MRLEDFLPRLRLESPESRKDVRKREDIPRFPSQVFVTAASTRVLFSIELLQLAFPRYSSVYRYTSFHHRALHELTRFNFFSFFPPTFATGLGPFLLTSLARATRAASQSSLFSDRSPDKVTIEDLVSLSFRVERDF